MKLSLNELRVDSYATQLNEKEVTEIKGGSTRACEQLYFEVVILPVVMAFGAVLAGAAAGVNIPVDAIPTAPSPK